jgi:hypothetical protein
MDALSDLTSGAKVVAGILGIVAIFLPFLARLGKVKEIVFGMPNLFSLVGSLAAFVAFLYASSILRDRLHLLSSCFLCFVVAVLSLTLLGALATTVKDKNPRPIHVLVGLPLYALATAGIFFGVTRFAAEKCLYWRLYGTVKKNDMGVGGSLVSVTKSMSSTIMTVKTDSQGHYQFLLTREEAKDAAEIWLGPEDQRVQVANLQWPTLEQRELCENVEVAQ